MICVRWSRSHTSSSIRISVESLARRTMRTLPMLPSAAPVTCARSGGRLLVELGFRHDGTDHIFYGEFAAAHAGVHLLHRFLRQPRQALLELLVGIVLADPEEGGDEQAPAELGVLAAQSIARRAT